MPSEQVRLHAVNPNLWIKGQTQDLRLQFEARNPADWDRGYIEYSEDGGTTWGDISIHNSDFSGQSPFPVDARSDMTVEVTPESVGHYALRCRFLVGTGEEISNPVEVKVLQMEGQEEPPRRGEGVVD